MSAGESQQQPPAQSENPATTQIRKSASKTLEQRIKENVDEHQNEIREAFSSISKDGKYIDDNELKFAMRALGFEPKKEEIKNILSQLEKESTTTTGASTTSSDQSQPPNTSTMIPPAAGKVSYDQFLVVMAKKFEEKGTREEIMKAFSLFDVDGSGRITFENLKQVAAELGENIDDQELRDMIAEADRDGDGGVDRDEFFRIMKKTCLY